MDTMIKENLDIVTANITNACQQSIRDRNQITLIAVSKTKPISLLEEAYELGCRDFGENKVQELLHKYESMPKDIRWHMIGHLQRNKVKYIIDKVHLIHSVDSLSLAQEIQKEAAKKQIIVSILVEVNIANEESKYGIAKEECFQLVEEIAKFPNISIKGLMTIAPYVITPEANRKFFKSIYQLSVDIMKKNIDNVSVDILSMGMTGDYETAIEEGSTCIRVGTGIFGERDYTSNK